MASVPLNKILDAIETTLNGSSIDFSQVETYEGQLEDIENCLITPPSAFYEIEMGRSESENYLIIDTTLNLYLCANHMKGNKPTSMYTILWTLISEFHQAAIDDYSCFFTGFERLGIFPGFCVYRASFTLKYEPGA